MIYTVEKLLDIIEELTDLVNLHYEEMRPYDDIPLLVDWHRLIGLERMGVLKLYTARKEGVLVGYASFIVYPSMEYSTTLQASLTNIFIHAQHRGRGGAFISWCDEELKKLSVKIVYHHVKVKNDYGVLLKRLGYDMMNIEYAKRLDK